MNAPVYYQHGRFAGPREGPAWRAHLAIHDLLGSQDEEDALEAAWDLRQVAKAFPDETRAVVEQYPLDMVRRNAGTARGILRHEIDIATGASPAGSDAPAPTKSKLLTPADVTDRDILANDYLIKGWLDQRSDGLAFGTWNVGKTFVILDLLATVALGVPWFGARVRKSRVLYLAYEGHAGIKKRVRALQQKYPDLNGAAFAWWPMRHALTTTEGRAEIDAARRDFAARFGGAPDLIAIDPLRNALGASDSDADKVEVLKAQTRALMEADGCAVLLVHHAGHSNKDRARGDSGIVAGADSEMRIDGPEQKGAPHTITSTKQRDARNLVAHFQLATVDLGVDEDGDPVTTCTVQPAEAMVPEFATPAPSVADRIAEAETTVLRLLAREVKAGVEHSVDSLTRLAPLHGLTQRTAGAVIARLEGRTTGPRIERVALVRKGGRGRAYRLELRDMPEEGAAGEF